MPLVDTEATPGPELEIPAATFAWDFRDLISQLLLTTALAGRHESGPSWTFIGLELVEAAPC